MKAPLPGNLVVTQLYGSLRGGPGEAYDVWHDGEQYRCIGHPALDFDAPLGTPVTAMSAGILHFPTDLYSPFLGLHAVLTLPSGEQHWYAHLSQKVAQEGLWIPAGAEIALSGASGNVTGPHLHVAVRPAKPDYAAFDGFIDFLSHFDHSVYPLFNLSLV